MKRTREIALRVLRHEKRHLTLLRVLVLILVLLQGQRARKKSTEEEERRV
jgi:hypothetical protein